jgi:hypothetical protein
MSDLKPLLLSLFSRLIESLMSLSISYSASEFDEYALIPVLDCNPKAVIHLYIAITWHMMPKIKLHFQNLFWKLFVRILPGNTCSPD